MAIPFDIIGLAAATLTTSAFIPQAMKVIREKDTKSLSFSMYAMFTSGVAMWLIYGILINNMPIIISNAVTGALALVILTMKIKLG